MRALLFSACLLAASAFSFADSWPTFRGGPERTDISKETGLLKQWPADGPKQLWHFADAGLGYSGVSVVGDTLFTMGARDGKEFLIAINVADGKQKWSTEIAPQLKNNWGDGPRGTPTVDADRVYAISGQGNIVCAKVGDGSVIWKSSMKELNGKQPGWGYTESPLIDGEHMVCTPGGKDGTLAALDKMTGKVAWRSKDFTEDAQYASIIAFDFGGKHQLAQLTTKKLAGVDAKTGEKLWESEWGGKTAVIPTLIFHDGYVFVTSGYGSGCKLVKLEDGKATDVYANKDMSDHHGGVILVGENLYGHSNEGGWMCMDFKTGKIQWAEKKALGKGAIACADGMLYLLGEKDGAVVLIDASPKGWQEHGRFKLSPLSTQRSKSGGIWMHPVIADGKLYLRDQENLMCYDIKAK